MRDTGAAGAGLSALGRLLALALAAAPPAHAAESGRRLVVGAWERPEDLRFLPEGVEDAVQTGFVDIIGGRLSARGPRFPARLRPGEATTALVHVQIDRRAPLAWSPALEA